MSFDDLEPVKRTNRKIFVHRKIFVQRVKLLRHLAASNLANMKVCFRLRCGRHVRAVEPIIFRHTEARWSSLLSGREKSSN
jgi:hypothetical protein